MRPLMPLAIAPPSTGITTNSPASRFTAFGYGLISGVYDAKKRESSLNPADWFQKTTPADVLQETSSGSYTINAAHDGEMLLKGSRRAVIHHARRQWRPDRVRPRSRHGRRRDDCMRLRSESRLRSGTARMVGFAHSWSLLT